MLRKHFFSALLLGTGVLTASAEPADAYTLQELMALERAIEQGGVIVLPRDRRTDPFAYGGDQDQDTYNDSIEQTRRRYGWVHDRDDHDTDETAGYGDQGDLRQLRRGLDGKNGFCGDRCEDRADQLMRSRLRQLDRGRLERRYDGRDGNCGDDCQEQVERAQDKLIRQFHREDTQLQERDEHRPHKRQKRQSTRRPRQP